jgi:hypothetical protein
MKISRMQRRVGGALALIASATLLVSCGGGDGSSATGASSTDAVAVTVIDGAIKGATVCLDKNLNGACDNGEPSGKTDAAGKVTLTVDKADTGKYPVLAVVGTDAVDADHGPVTTAFVLTAPADQTAVVSPITTLVQQLIVGTGISTAEAAATVQALTGLSVSVFTDYTATATPTAGTDPGTLARMLVVAAQEQSKVIAAAQGTTAIDGQSIGLADLQKAVQSNLLQRIPALVTAATAPDVLNAASAVDKAAALLAAAVTLSTDSSALTLAGISTAVAINNQLTAPQAAYVPDVLNVLGNLSFTDAANYYAYIFSSTLEQDTPDASNNTRYINRNYSSVAGNLATWSSGSRPSRQSDLNWNGSAWVDCPLNFEGKATIPDARGYNSYVDCNMRSMGAGTRATFDVAGKTMLEVYESLIAAGYTNFNIANAASALGGATFPAGSKLYYTSGSTSTGAITYSPAGKENPAGVSNAVGQYSPEVTAGGDTRLQAPGTGCTSAAANGNGTTATTLEGMIAAFSGNPCISSPGNTFTYQSVVYTNPDPTNEAWYAAALGLGNLGTAMVGSGPAPGFYTSNIKFRVAFKGSGVNPTTYYACKERFNNGSTRNCTPIGTGTYTITTLGDGRAMTFNNLPAQMAPLTFNQVFVERGGAVHYGFQNKPAVRRNARFTKVAAAALLNQLGLPAVDANAPLALTAGSYQGTWDARETDTPVTAPGTAVVIKSDGTATCQGTADLAAHSCTVTIANAATGAFTALNNGSTLTGTFDFATGSGSGTYVDLVGTPSSGSFVIFRR